MSVTTEAEPSRVVVVLQVGFEGKRWKEFFVLVLDRVYRVL